jgi:hypothetical protein
MIFFTSLVKIVPSLDWFGFQGPLKKTTQEGPLLLSPAAVVVVVAASPHQTPPASSFGYCDNPSLANHLQLEMGILLLLPLCIWPLLSLSLSPTSLFLIK